MQRSATTASLQLWQEIFVHNSKNNSRILAIAVVDMESVEQENRPCDVCNTEETKQLPVNCEVRAKAE